MSTHHLADHPTGHPTVLGERYRLDALLASGGMADVYRSTDLRLDRPVAVKVLRDVSHTERFTDEAMTLAKLSHPGLVAVHDAGVTDGCSWLVMDLVDGVALSTLTGSVLPYDRVAEIGRQLAEALASVHAQGVVHRDVKPANALLRTDGRVVLTDFGIARLVEHLEGRTEAGTTMGTAAYLSPEQVRGAHPTTAVDVYSLGLVLLELLTGQRAYPGSTVESAVARLSAPPELPAHLPASWRDLLAAMTATDPSARPRMAEVAQRLARLAANTPPAPGAAGHTRVLPALDELPTRRVPLVSAPSAGPQRGGVVTDGAASLRRRSPYRSRALLALAGAAAVLLLVVLLASLGGGHSAAVVPNAPQDVPSQLRAPLQQLHDAVSGKAVGR